MFQSTRNWRLRFGLKTLFVLIAVFSMWLGYVMNQVRERTKALAELREKDGARIVTADEWSNVLDEWSSLVYDLEEARKTIPVLPFYRRWLGDEAISSISFAEPSEAELSRFQRLFPEAEVSRSRALPRFPSLKPIGWKSRSRELPKEIGDKEYALVAVPIHHNNSPASSKGTDSRH